MTPTATATPEAEHACAHCPRCAAALGAALVALIWLALIFLI